MSLVQDDRRPGASALRYAGLVLLGVLLSGPVALAGKAPPATKAPPVSDAAPAKKAPPPVARKPVTPSTGSKAPPNLAGIETAVLVLDASASMAELIDGKAKKMDAAKSAVSKLLDSWDADVPLGLTAYGHGGGGCTDIELVVPVEKLSRAKYQAAVNALVPTGKTPLTEAVIAAAEQLDYTENQATVIVVSDGLETCGADPCEMAAALKKMAVDLTVHVIGLGVSAEESKGLACIATNTGGTYKNADDAAQLDKALKDAASDVRGRKQDWRKRCGTSWGRNGRWRSGRWSNGKADGRRSAHWVELRKRWQKKYGRPGPGNRQWSADGRNGRTRPSRGARSPGPGKRPPARKQSQR